MPLRTVSGNHAEPRKGRGATVNPEGRFESVTREAFDDGWDRADDETQPLATFVTEERAKSIIARNDSPDIPFTQSINPYRGCEHGCVYCYARPSHAYLNLSPGLDFETRLFAKVNAAELLRAELAKPGYACDAIALGANTDPYQPIEREYRLTRSILEVLTEHDHPVAIVTKNALVERDIDLLAPLAQKGLARVFLSIATLDHEVSRPMEPRASAPRRRLEAIRRLAAAGIPTGVVVAPVVPFLTDHDIERVLDAAAEAGATYAGYVLLRLPFEVKELFAAWLETHFPLKAAHVMSRVRAMREGRANDPEFGSRMKGTGRFAELLAQRFERSCTRLGLNRDRAPLDRTRFRRPWTAPQLELF